MTHHPACLAALAAAALLAASPALQAQETAAAASAPPAASAAQVPPAATEGVELTEGEVRKIDLEGGRITLRHGNIRHLDMPAMTMVFAVASPALLNGVNVGDKVRFRVERMGGGYLLTRLERQQ